MGFHTTAQTSSLIAPRMILFTLILYSRTLVEAQSNLNGLLSAGESFYSSVIQTNSNQLGALATAAQSLLSTVEPSASSTASQTTSQTASLTLSSTLRSSVVSSTSPLSTASPSSSSDPPTISSTSSRESSQTSSASALSTSSADVPTSTSSLSSAVEAGVQATNTSKPDSKHSQHDTDTLLGIILPTVLSGLTLLVLLAILIWLCMRRRRRAERYNSGLERLYAADTTRRSPSVMEERVDSTLLPNHRATSPALGAGTSETIAHGHHHSPPMPAPSMQRQLAKHSMHEGNKWNNDPSHFSTSTSTNGASVISPSHSGGASANEPHMSPEERRSYQPVTSQDEPAELDTGVTSAQGHFARAHTPPLQSMFPGFGGPSVPRRSSKRKNGGVHVHYPSQEEAGGFMFGFPSNSHHHGAYPALPTHNKRYSIPRKPVAGR